MVQAYMSICLSFCLDVSCCRNVYLYGLLSVSVIYNQEEQGIAIAALQNLFEELAILS